MANSITNYAFLIISQLDIDYGLTFNTLLAYEDRSVYAERTTVRYDVCIVKNVPLLADTFI